MHLQNGCQKDNCPSPPAVVPLDLSPPPTLASQSFLPSTPTTWAASAWPRPPSPGWRTNLASTFPSSSPRAWPPFITRSRRPPPHQLRPSRGSDAAHHSSILLLLLHQEPVTQIDTQLSHAPQAVGPFNIKDNQRQPVARPPSPGRGSTPLVGWPMMVLESWLLPRRQVQPAALLCCIFSGCGLLAAPSLAFFSLTFVRNKAATLLLISRS